MACPHERGQRRRGRVAQGRLQRPSHEVALAAHADDVHLRFWRNVATKPSKAKIMKGFSTGGYCGDGFPGTAAPGWAAAPPAAGTLLPLLVAPPAATASRLLSLLPLLLLTPSRAQSDSTAHVAPRAV